MARNNSNKGSFHFNNMEKMNKNFMYNNLTRSNCYNSRFAGSNFNYVCFRGAHFKSCDFYGCTFKGAEFIGTNLKSSKFRNAEFEDTIFEGVNLDGVDFRDAKFVNTTFLFTDISKAKNLNPSLLGIRVLDEMPEVNISKELEEAIKASMNNEFVKKSRVLDMKDGSINLLNIETLLAQFSEETLIKGFNLMETEIKNDFHTLSYIIKFMKNI